MRRRDERDPFGRRKAQLVCQVATDVPHRCVDGLAQTSFTAARRMNPRAH